VSFDRFAILKKAGIPPKHTLFLALIMRTLFLHMRNEMKRNDGKPFKRLATQKTDVSKAFNRV